MKYGGWIALVLGCWGVMGGVAGGETDFTEVAKGAEYVPGEVLVRFAPKERGQLRTVGEKHAIVDAVGAGTIRRNYRIVPGLCLVRLPEGMTVPQAVAQFGARSEVLYVEPNY